MPESLRYNKDHGFLTGKLLVATPYLEDQRFQHSVIYICGHDQTGSMGLIINKRLQSVTFKDLLEQLDMEYAPDFIDTPLNYGGPTEVGKGFVLHTMDYLAQASITINDIFALTATVEILRAISLNRGPRQALMALGYVSWGAMQLEAEIQNNGWIAIDAEEDLIFAKDIDHMWHRAMASIGVNPNHIAADIGHA